MESNGNGAGVLAMGAVPLLAFGLVVLAAAPAAGFEGTLKLRTLTLPRETLAYVIGAKSGLQADQAFDTPMEKLLALQGMPGIGIEESTVYISGQKLRADSPLPEDPSAYAVFDTDLGVTRIVLPKEKRYFEWGREDAEALGGQLRQRQEQAQRRIQRRLESLPANERKQAEAMLRQGAEDPPALQPIEGGREINGFPATAYQIELGKETTRGWVTQTLPVLAKVYRMSQESLRGLTPGGGRDPRGALADHGLPVRVQTLGPAQYRVEDLVAVAPGPLAADLFDVPSGFSRSALPDPAAGQGDAP